MNSFQYVTAHNVDEAMSLVGNNGRYLGGGIDLLSEMKDYIVSPDVLVNVKDALGPMNSRWDPSIKNDHTGCLIQSLVTIADIAAHPDIQKIAPGLSEAASEVGSPQIRNVATLAGNLLQHSRCWYYRQPDIVCLKRGGDMCHAQNGENKYHSLFSGNQCISPIVSNLAVILTALDAVAHVHVTRGGKPQQKTMAELYQEAWVNPTAHNSLDPQNFLTDIIFPLKRTRSAYRQVSEKREFDWALVSCAAAANVKNGKITDARVVLGAVAPVPYMVEDANKFLEGMTLNDEVASKAADIILKDAKPLAQNGYKVPLAHALIRRTLLALIP